MPNLFAITTTTNTLRLSEKRQGEAVFTVFNASGRAIRGRAVLQPEDPEASTWLRLDGEAGRTFPIAGTEQYTVRINVPPDAPVGSYPFRLDMVGVERPDEDYARGQTVTFEIREPEAQRKPFPVWIVLVAVGALLLGGVLWYVARPAPLAEVTPAPLAQVSVPDVTGFSVEGAMSDLQQAGLQIGQEQMEPHESVVAGLVIRTEPAANDLLEEGSLITLIISAGSDRVQVPDVGGDEVFQALTKLHELGLRWHESLEQRFHQTIPAGRVVGTEPPKDAAVEPGEVLQLIVSRGPRGPGSIQPLGPNVIHEIEPRVLELRRFHEVQEQRGTLEQR